MSTTRPEASQRPSVQHISTTYPKATKYHRCLMCGELIHPNQRHIKAVYFDHEAIGRGFRSSRTHLHCGASS